MNSVSKRRIAKFPRVGNRLIKTAVSVFICCIIYMIRGSGSLFYSVLAAIFALQADSNMSKSNIKDRVFGTFNGGVLGCLILVFDNAFLTNAPEILRYFVLSLSCIMVIYVSLLLKQDKVAYFSCAVFYSIAIVHLNATNPYIFALGRMIDTIIGGLVALFVNRFHLPYRVDNKTLFVTGLDETLLDSEGKLSKYSIFEINRMIEKGALFTIATERSVGAMMDEVKPLKINLPVIPFNGALLFDINSKTYLRRKIISRRVVDEIKEICKEERVCCFSTALLQDTLLIYHDELYSYEEGQVYQKLRTSLYLNFINGPISEEADVVYLMCIDKDEHITKLYHRLKNSSFAEHIKMIRRISGDFEGYTFLKIYDKDCSKQNMLEELKGILQVEKTVTFGTTPNGYDIQIKDNDHDEVVRKIKKMYEKISLLKK